MKKTIKKLSIFVLSLLIVALFSCQAKNDKEVASLTEINQSSKILEATEDMGEEYIDSFIFFGESTTYHIKSRGVLKGGTSTLQVWGNESGTFMLDASIEEAKITYPETNEKMKLSEALAKATPKYIFLSFGLNGAIRNASGDGAYFKSCYEKLIDLIKTSSPKTVIILNSCFPVAKNMDTSNFSCDVEMLNQYIDAINVYTREIALQEDVYFLNSAEVLKDNEGYLKNEFQAGDGYHLTKEAYVTLLKYIRTHGCK